MLLESHVVIALCGLIWTSYVVLFPTAAKISASYGFVAATLLTGTALVISSGQHILQSCVTGLIYTAVVTTGIAVAQRRLADQTD